MKTIVNIYSNSIGSITHYSVREWSINIYAVERFVLESKITEEQKKVFYLNQVFIFLLMKNVHI